MFDVSVITAVYATKKHEVDWLRECVQSVADSEGLVIEHIVVDDGSTIDIKPALLPSTKLIRLTRNFGVAKARNLGIEKSTADYFFVLDADDTIYFDALAILYQKACPSKYTYGMLEYVDRTGLTTLKKTGAYYSADFLRNMQGFTGVNALQHKSLFNALGGYDPSLSALEDMEYWIRASALGVCGTFVAIPMVKYRQNIGGRSAMNNSPQKHPAVLSSIKALHPLFFRGGEMPCRSCSNQVPNLKKSVELEAGHTLVQYTGPQVGSFMILVKGNRFAVEGKGAFFQIKNDLVQDLMRMGNYQVAFNDPLPAPIEKDPDIENAIEHEMLPEVATVAEKRAKK